MQRKESWAIHRKAIGTSCSEKNLPTALTGTTLIHSDSGTSEFYRIRRRQKEKPQHISKAHTTTIISFRIHSLLAQDLFLFSASIKHRRRLLDVSISLPRLISRRMIIHSLAIRNQKRHTIKILMRRRAVYSIANPAFVIPIARRWWDELKR